MNPRTSIEDLKLQGGNNLRRAVARERADAEKPPLTAEQESEIEKVDALISQAMAACRRGQTVKGKRNPAFANLAELVKVRKFLEARRVDPAKEGASVMKEVDELLKGVN